MEKAETALRGSVSNAVPVTNSYWLITDVARPRSDTGDLIIVDERWRLSPVPLRVRCASDPPVRARVLSVLAANERTRAISDGVLSKSRRPRSNQYFVKAIKKGALKGYWQKNFRDGSGNAAADSEKGNLENSGANDGDCPNQQEMGNRGRWPGILYLQSALLPSYELGREKGASGKLKRKWTDERVDGQGARPLPSRFHVALSPEAMRGRVKAPGSAYQNVEPGTRNEGKIKRQLRTTATKPTPTSKDAIATEATTAAEGCVAVEGPASFGDLLGSDVLEQLLQDFERFLDDEERAQGMSTFSAARIDDINGIESAPLPRQSRVQDEAMELEPTSPFSRESRSPRPASASADLAPFEGVSTRNSKVGGLDFHTRSPPAKVQPNTEEQRLAASRQLGFETSPVLGSATRQARRHPWKSPSTALTPFHPTLSTSLQTAHNDPFPGTATNRLQPITPPSLDGVLGHHLEPWSADSASYFMNEGPPALRNSGCVIAAPPALEVTRQQHPSGRPAKLQVCGRGRQKESNAPLETLGPLGATPISMRDEEMELNAPGLLDWEFLLQLERADSAGNGEKEALVLNSTPSEVSAERGETAAVETRPAVPQLRSYDALLSEIVDSCLGEGAAIGPGEVATCIEEHRRLMEEVQQHCESGMAGLEEILTKQDKVQVLSTASKEATMQVLLSIYSRAQGNIAQNLQKALEALIGHSSLYPSESLGKGKGLSGLHSDFRPLSLRKVSDRRTSAGKRPLEDSSDKRTEFDMMDLAVGKSSERERKQRIRRTVFPDGKGRDTERKCSAERKRRRLLGEDSDSERFASAREERSRAETSKLTGSSETDNKKGQGERGSMHATKSGVSGRTGLSGNRGNLPKAAADAIRKWFIERYLENLENGVSDPPRETKEERRDLATKLSITEAQVKTKLVNDRGRIWKDLMGEVYEEVKAKGKKSVKSTPSPEDENLTRLRS